MIKEIGGLDKLRALQQQKDMRINIELLIEQFAGTKIDLDDSMQMDYYEPTSESQVWII